MELTSPYKRHYGIFAGIQQYAAEHADWSFDLGNYPEILLAQGKRFDGVIGRISKDRFVAANQAAIPAVNVMIDSPVFSQVSGVYIDFQAAGRIAAEHLIARGLRELAQFGFTGSQASKQHLQGMREVAGKHGYPCRSYTISPHYDGRSDRWTKFTESVERIQSDWEAPLGVGFISDGLCRSVASACLTLGWVIPEQLALVGSGNHELICNAIEPTLSSIDMGDEQCGYEAAGLLDEFMQGVTQRPQIHYTPPKELVVRSSSDVFAVSDIKVAQSLRYMADHAGEPLSVSSIAATVGVGRQSLERRFRRHVGRSINEELIRLRVETLKRLLVEGDDPVKTLSAEAGFRTTVSMHTMFKRLTGITPGAYRERHDTRLRSGL